MPGRLLPRQFYARDALEVARDLLHQDAEWRIAVAGSAWVSHARQLRGEAS